MKNQEMRNEKDTSRMAETSRTGKRQARSGAFVWAIALGALFILVLPIIQFLSESQNAESSVEAISTVDLLPVPELLVEEESGSGIEPLLPDELNGEDDRGNSPSGTRHDHEIASVIGAESLQKHYPEQLTGSKLGGRESAWYRIEPMEGPDMAITIMMPGEATFRESYSRSPLGKVSHHTYTAKGEVGTFTASYSALPKHSLTLAGKKTIFTKARDTVLEKADADQISMEPTNCMGIPGMKLAYKTRAVEGAPSFEGVAHMFIIDRTIVVFNAVLSNQRPADYVDRYFETIEVMNPLAAVDGLGQLNGCQAT